MYTTTIWWEMVQRIMIFGFGIFMTYWFKREYKEELEKLNWYIKNNCRPRIVFKHMYYDPETGEEAGRKLISIRWFHKD